MTRYLWITVTAACLLLGQATARADTIPEIVAKTKAAVVEIVTIGEKGSTNHLGTGFFVSSDGHVVTNQHVIEGAASIAAVNSNGAIFLFERMVAEPAGVDLAILKFRASDVPFLTLGKSTTAVEGQKVIVIGNPTGLTGTVSDGIISAFRENRSLIQITAPISPGSSGSPVMDENGQVIGVATLQSVEGQNLNFAIAVEKVSAALVKSLSEQIAGSRIPTPTPAIDANAYFARGMESFGRKDYDNAISDFTEAIRRDPNNASAYVNRAISYEDQGNFGKAISDYNVAIRLDPNLAIAYYNRGNAYYNHGELANAMSDYDEAIRLDPNLAPAYVGRGLAYDQYDNLDKAISDYSEAIRLDPNDAPAHYNRGVTYSHKRSFDKAISDFTEAIRLDPNFAPAYYSRGVTYGHKRSFDKEISDYSEVIRLNPNFAAAYVNRGTVYGKTGKHAEAISDFTKAIQLDPTDALAYNNRGIAYLHIGNRAKANADFATAKRLKAGQ